MTKINGPGMFATGTKPAVECLGLKFSNDDERRSYFLEQLREKLKDPQFRKIEGFPIAKDEDILSLSDPPYFTECPNPFLRAFIEHVSHRDETPYHCEPFTADVSEGKNHPIYGAHSYHTKVPHRAIMRYILRYTQPGDVVFDGFCGTGMTGVAARMCGDRAEVQALGYRIQNNGIVLDEEGKPFSKLGARYAILNDLSPAATFIAYNYNTSVNPAVYEQQVKRILGDVRKQYGWMYVTLHGATKDEIAAAAKMIAKCKSLEECRLLLANSESLKNKAGLQKAKFTLGSGNYNVWSDVFTCPECSAEINFVSEALDIKTKRVKDVLHCPHCRSTLTKRQMDRATEHWFDPVSKSPVQRAKQQLALINYDAQGTTYEKLPDVFDIALDAKISDIVPENFYPTARMPKGDESRRNDPIGLTHVHHFYRPRALCTLSAAYSEARSAPEDLKRYLIFTVEQAVLGMSKIARYAPTHYSQVNQYLSGTLYVGSQVVDVSLEYILDGKTKNLVKILKTADGTKTCFIDTRSSSSFSDLPNDVLDYIFVDPPFGGNLTYSALNFFWESWLRITTDSEPEAITNQLAGKGHREYQALMAPCFKEFFRVLKPGHWMTVEFSNTQASVWNAIQVTLQEAGFVVANVSALDKQQGSFKAVTTTTAVKQDLVISAYKPNGGFEKRFLKEAQSEEGVWDFVATHLQYLPVTKRQGMLMQMVPERDPRILFDQLVAFYIRNGYPVPISSVEFQTGLSQRFPERDGMYFLPSQVTEYDKSRITAKGLEQPELFVSDERSAVQWVRRQLTERPMKYQDLSPLYMKEAQRVWEKHEQPLELRTILEQNFVESKDGIWRVPDPKKEGDLEQIRHRALMKEFQSYVEAKGKLKLVRTEALRAGFKESWQKRDYKTIVEVAKRVPENLVQEDSSLLMYYDNAVMRTGE